MTKSRTEPRQCAEDDGIPDITRRTADLCPSTMQNILSHRAQKTRRFWSKLGRIPPADDGSTLEWILAKICGRCPALTETVVDFDG